MNACFFGCFGDDFIALTGISVSVSLKDDVRDVPRFEELGEKGLGCFSEDEKLRFGVEFGDGL